MDPTEKLAAIEEIKQLKARYFRCLDTKDWDAYADVFAPDAVMDARHAFEAVDPGNGESRVYGRPDLLAAIDASGWVTRSATEIAKTASEFFTGVSTVHQGHTPEIEILSAERATGVWAMEEKLRFPPGGPFETLHGFGHYHETYVRLVAGWRIETTKLVRLRIDVA